MKKLFCLMLILMSTHIFGAFEVFDFEDGNIGITTDSTDDNASIVIKKEDGILITHLSIKEKILNKKVGESFSIEIKGDNGDELSAKDWWVLPNGTILKGEDVISTIKASNYIDIKVVRARDNKTWNFKFSCAGYTKNIGKVKEKK